MSTCEDVMMAKENQVHKTYSPVPNKYGHSRNAMHAITTCHPSHHHAHFYLSYHSHLTKTSTVLPGECSVEPPSTSLMNDPAVKDIYIQFV